MTQDKFTRGGKRPIRLPPQPRRVLLPLANLNEARILIPLFEIISKACQGQMTILTVTAVPEGILPSEVAAQTSRFREALEPFIAENFGAIPQIKSLVRPQGEIWDGIWEVISQDGIDTLVLGWSTPTLLETAVGEMRDQRLAAPPCDIIAVRPSKDLATNHGWDTVKRVLLPVRSSPYAGLALRIANDIARATDTHISLLHTSTKALRQAEDQLFRDFGPALRNLERLNRSLTVVSNVAEAIIAEAINYQVIVMGAPITQVHPDGWSGPLLDEVIANTDATLVIVKKSGSYQSTPDIIEQPGQIATTLGLLSQSPSPSRGDNPVAVVVDTWFAENTFHSREFADLERLVSLKESQNLTVSLGLPALNEAETVGNVIQTVKTALMDEIPLIDEIVLIDSGSIDYTREIAMDLGIPVYMHHEILPEHGAYLGKGEALWKSLHVLKGDIIAWIDTDIKNIHPRFVYGVLGPLLYNTHVQYVKGFYRRPLREGDKILAGGGGRVTELTARPFINLFFPELSGVIQPLSGEYAGRRQALEKLPFFIGYGVETGLMIDLLDEYGINSIAQVDLQERIHHNQPLPSLSKMSFSIMQVVFSRLEKRHNIRMLDEPNLTMNLIRYRPRQRYYLDPEEIFERERPPISSIPEYRQKHGLPPIDNRSN
jgi:glucosyl-3-phosphoglycerate synthase